jgi:ATP:ADP antiporter, AAA family
MTLRLFVSCAWFFLVLFSYYVLKPVRDALATETRLFGPLYFATFLAASAALPLYWRIVARTTRRQLVFGVYQFFVACLVVFALLLARGYGDTEWLRNAFFVWVSVFNLYVVAVFWSVMADLFSAEEGKSWFGAMAAAGTVGSILASLVGHVAAQRLGVEWLMVVAIGALELAIAMAWLALRFAQREGPLKESLWEGSPTPKPVSGPKRNEVVREIGVGDASHKSESSHRSQPKSSERPSSGSLLAGLRTVLSSRYLLMICAFTAIGKFAATFVYNNFQHTLREEGLAVAERTELFSAMNFYSQTGTLAFQAVLAAALMRLAGVGATLALACSVIVGLFAWLSFDATLWPLMVAKVVQEIVGYGLLVPAQQVLFTVVSRTEKYESKAFIDTVVFRGSDVAAANVVDGLGRFSASAAALTILPLVGVWMALGAWLGREQSARAQAVDGKNDATAQHTT